MPSALPLGDPAPPDGALPASVVEDAGNRRFGIYIHVPFCRVRCGYCDFNTYTSDQLSGARRGDYAGQAIAELVFAAGVLQQAGLPERPVSTVFFGGGTPTLLPASDLAAMLAATIRTWGLARDAEVTAEANPDSVDLPYLIALRRAGFTRVSFGMQSAVPKVLATLDRTHNPERIPLVVAWAREAGLQVSVDLIYGSPGETMDDWRLSLLHAIAQAPDHISAYALIVEDGTRLARQVRKAELPAPDDDLAAEMYEYADSVLVEAGYEWYEVSNWAKTPDDAVTDPRSRHNLGYWQGHDWWGVGPGAHSHVGGVRWWNLKHPAAWAERILAGRSPAAGREILDGPARRMEAILLGTRIRQGVPTAELAPRARLEVAALVADGLVDGEAALTGSVVLTLRGRLLADAVVRRLVA